MTARLLRMAMTGVFALGLARAPIQCASRPRPEAAHEDDPPEALWRLAERFGTENNAASHDETLRFLIERYPNSRWAERARMALAGDASAP